ncbi:hypothetical protein Pcinc_004785 [Petrolisthes cinctipes]|uniref:Protein kinase domain-containing protein n=1 Tax=Petrolisthes cinctipes TaxID=88211 RepID=A0AAE1G0Y7_PETCI|nr:hypothetical protein Pcinc_014178 [Petrolisthes cinctipes]KAK3891342.1 hypothetical protein Pcinc_004785 [Petrolisthes cinctipes]
MGVNVGAEEVRQEDQDTAWSETDEDLNLTRTYDDEKTDTLDLAKLGLPAAHILEEIEDYQFLGGGVNAEVFTVKYQGRLACLKEGRNDSITNCFRDEADILLEVGGAGGAPTLLAYATDAPLIVTTLCQGVQLRDWIHSQPPYMNTTNFLDLAKEVATNLRDIHYTDVIHNDIKDDNILVYFTDGRPKINIIDFGLATKIGYPVYFIYNTPEVYYRFPWYAPEVFYGKTTNYRSDVYSLGVLFHNILRVLSEEECLTFQPPWDLINLLDHMTHYDWIKRPSMYEVKGGEKENGEEIGGEEENGEEESGEIQEAGEEGEYGEEENRDGENGEKKKGKENGEKKNGKEDGEIEKDGEKEKGEEDGEIERDGEKEKGEEYGETEKDGENREEEGGEKPNWEEMG